MTQRKRSRLSPAARQAQLLDIAKQLIADRGLQQFGLDQVAAEAGVSAQLVYHYFPSRLELLQALLARDYKRYAQEVYAAVQSAQSVEEIVRVYVQGNFDHRSPGNIITTLTNEPDIAAGIRDELHKHRADRGSFLVKTIARDFGFDVPKAALLVRMASAASIAAAEHASETHTDVDAAIDTVMAFIFAGFESQRQSRPA